MHASACCDDSKQRRPWHSLLCDARGATKIDPFFVFSACPTSKHVREHAQTKIHGKSGQERLRSRRESAEDEEHQGDTQKRDVAAAKTKVDNNKPCYHDMGVMVSSHAAKCKELGVFSVRSGPERPPPWWMLDASQESKRVDYC